MLKRLTFISTYKYTFLFTSVCLLISCTLVLLSRNTIGFAQWYAVSIYPGLNAIIGGIFSAGDFSFFEAGVLLIAALAAILTMAGLIILMLRSRVGRGYMSLCFRLLLCFMAGMMLLYTATCSVNYQRDGIGSVLNLPEHEVSKDKLIKISILLAEDLDRLTSDPDWNEILLSAENREYIEKEAVAAMRELGKKEPSLGGYYSEPKPVYFSDLMTSYGIEGIFSPFTMEANYNDRMTPFLIPYTICHELAHTKGYMKEDDAGFIAYLACVNSSSKVFQYSGAFHALSFSLNSLKAEVSPSEFNEIYQKLPQSVRIQLSYIKSQNVKSKPQNIYVTEKINNLYLEANAQQGTKSYGYMVDLIIAELSDRIEVEKLI